MSVAFDDHGDTVPGRGTTIERLAAGRAFVLVRTVGQQTIERRKLGGREIPRDFDKMPIRRRNAGDGVVGTGSRERGFELGYAERRQRVTPAQRKELRHVRRKGRKWELYAHRVGSNCLAAGVGFDCA